MMRNSVVGFPLIRGHSTWENLFLCQKEVLSRIMVFFWFFSHRGGKRTDSKVPPGVVRTIQVWRKGEYSELSLR